MRDLSVLIPARSERWLNRTIADVLQHSEAGTEVIVVLDGEWPDEPLVEDPRLHVVYLPESIGQRAATNLAARLSSAEFLVKLDAHCSVAPGWDLELIKAARELGPRVTQIPSQRNLHIWDRVCRTCGKRNYQGPVDTPCDCGGPCDLDVVWKPRGGTTTTCWYFDAEPHFQYAPKEMRKRQAWRHDIADVMTSIGACFFMSREFFWEIGGLDEDHGSWGNFGIEIACKAWLSGGRHVTNRRTWFAHLFRVGGIGFPYTIHGSDQQKARAYSRDLWFNGRWAGQVRPLSWLVDKFWPVPGWSEEQRGELKRTSARGHRRTDESHQGIEQRGEPVAVDLGEGPALSAVAAVSSAAATAEPLSVPAAISRQQPARSVTRGICYYSDNRPDARILEASRQSIEASGMPIVAVTLAPIRWPSARNIVLDAKRGTLTMFRQILAGLEALDTDDVFFAEHDVIYDRSHWQFALPTRGRYYYGINTWKVETRTGRAVHYRAKQTSGLCADRQLLIAHYRKRIELVERDGFSRAMGFEPGSHRRHERVDDVRAEEWWSASPNVDIRHTANLTPSRWATSEFRSQRNCQGWTEADGPPGLGITKGRFWEWLAERSRAEVAA